MTKLGTKDVLFEVGEKVWTVSGGDSSAEVDGPFEITKILLSKTRISYDTERLAKKGYNDAPSFDQKDLFNTEQEAEVVRSRKELQYYQSVVTKYKAHEEEATIKLQKAIDKLPPHRREAVEATAHKHEGHNV